MYRICKIMWIETGHFLSSSKNSSNCRMPHGHSRKVEIVLASKKLDENSMVCDFQIIKSAFGEFIDSFDHAMLINKNSKHYSYFKENFERVIPFDTDPTSEIISEYFFKHIESQLIREKVYTNKDGVTYAIGDYVFLERVRVWETSSCWAEYSGE
ncbi:MAG TPA: 6-pyruvoyl tetrahydropterin synthase [Lentisphaeria bacterium]|nr:MAG: hypothetical protein A2X47_07735 [Lentisphaerae bacterium GWF2_38_69]HBM16484.1 6-pyruvoyl tetrahydropterin synthase [Lentisphaeria bacterium]